ALFCKKAPPGDANCHLPFDKLNDTTRAPKKSLVSDQPALNGDGRLADFFCPLDPPGGDRVYSGADTGSGRFLSALRE
ncbi:hypothetical protein KA005_79305, partial [bacterium]|nr:hypothetical protein [bacterium]